MARAEADQAPEPLAIEVAYGAAPHQVDLTLLQLPAGATVADALRASGVLQRHGLELQGLDVGVWGRACAPDRVLRDRDRVEVYRPLRVDPKEARRQRYKARPRGRAAPAPVSGNPTR
jgi:putative ubiquitin-RnfH superfamily antitoxin RatB of RatAB toxin-antitoxin module